MRGWEDAIEKLFNARLREHAAVFGNGVSAPRCVKEAVE